MTDTLLDPPALPERPAASIRPHGDHWDASASVTKDGGWTWRRVSAINLTTKAAALAWVARTEAA